MSIEQICRHDVVTIDEQATLKEAASLMRGQHVGALVVTATSGGDQPRVVGIITDRDLVLEILARDLAASDTRVGQLAQRHLAAVSRDAGIAEAAAEMQRAGVRRLLVTDAAGQLVGFVSSDDLLDALATELSSLASALRAGIAREVAQRKAISPPKPRPLFLPQGTPGWAA